MVNLGSSYFKGYFPIPHRNKTPTNIGRMQPVESVLKAHNSARQHQLVTHRNTGASAAYTCEHLTAVAGMHRVAVEIRERAVENGLAV